MKKSPLGLVKDDICESFRSVVRDCVLEIERRYDNQSDEEFPREIKINEYITDLIEPGQVSLLFSETGAGATSFLVKALCELDSEKYVALYSAPDIDSKQIMYRLIAIESGIPLHRLHNGRIRASEFITLVNACSRISDKNAYFAESRRVNPFSIKKELRSTRLTCGNGVFFLDDYYNMLSINSAEFSKRVLSLKELAIVCKARIIASVKVKSVDDFFPENEPSRQFKELLQTVKTHTFLLKKNKNPGEIYFSSESDFRDVRPQGYTVYQMM